MSIVQFLETLGASPNSMSGANYISAVEASGLDCAAREVLLARDADGLSKLLDGRTAMRCLVIAPD